MMAAGLSDALLRPPHPRLKTIKVELPADMVGDIADGSGISYSMRTKLREACRAVRHYPDGTIAWVTPGLANACDCLAESRGGCWYASKSGISVIFDAKVVKVIHTPDKRRPSPFDDEDEDLS